MVVSFLLAAYFVTAPAPGAPEPARELRCTGLARRAAPFLRGAGVFLLLFCIATGLLGSPDPAANFSMIFFWVVFVLGFAYASALLGDFYSVLNPWRTLAGWLDRAFRGYARGRLRYDERLGDWPAFALYMGFIGYELFNHGTPFGLGSMLLAYTVLNLAGVGLVGARAWFRHGELFSVFLRLIARMAPIELAGEPGRRTLRWRAPLSDLVASRPAHSSTVVFVLAMLATTAFDGLRATQWWFNLFWRDRFLVITPLTGRPPLAMIGELKPWYTAWETACLLGAPLLFLAAYLAALALARVITRTRRPLRELALDFAFTLLPIALVYSLTHYATLLLGYALKVVPLASDPFGWGWNLFGTVRLWRAPILPDMGVLWHSQVFLMLAGHVASVCVAHLVALRVFGSRRDALLSQLPMLALMVFLTVAGLWILSQPLTAEYLR